MAETGAVPSPKSHNILEMTPPVVWFTNAIVPPAQVTFDDTPKLTEAEPIVIGLVRVNESEQLVAVLVTTKLGLYDPAAV